MQEITQLNIGAAYIRVSTDDQTELSPDAQVRVILESAKADGYVIPQEYIFIEKKGISGRKADNRPEFQRMIAIAKSQSPAPFSRLYLWKFSRFARNQEESTFYKGILRKKCGVDIKSVSEPIMEGMFGRLIETIIEWFDEYYSFNLSGEVIRGMTEKALKEGYQSTPSLGYNAVGEGKPFVINEQEYAIVEFIHQSYHAGHDKTWIARECNRLGYHAKRGALFDIRAIDRILTNRFYIGEVKWNSIVFHGSHEVRSSIADVFDDNQMRLEREYRPFKRREVSSCKHWLSGMLKCGICGASLGFNRSSDLKRRGHIFQCWKYLKGHHTGSNSISVIKAEKAVLESLRQIMDSGELEFEYTPREDADTKTAQALLEDALARVGVKEQRIKEAYESGIDTIEEYKANKERIKHERDELINELDQIKNSNHTDNIGPTKEEMMSRIHTVYDILSDPDVDYDIKGNAIRSILKKVEIDKANGEFRFYYYA